MTDVNVESTDTSKEEGSSEELKAEKTQEQEVEAKAEETTSDENVEELKPKKESELDLVKKERDTFKEKFYYLAAEQENALKRFERESRTLLSLQTKNFYRLS